MFARNDHLWGKYHLVNFSHLETCKVERKVVILDTWVLSQLSKMR